MKNKPPEDVLKDIINTLSILIRTSQIHKDNNVALANIIKKFVSILNPLMSDNRVTIELVGEFFHINGTRVRYTMENVFNFDYLAKEFKRRNLGTLVFEDTLQDNDMKYLINAIIASELAEEPFKFIEEKLQGITNIYAEKLKKIKEEISGFDKKEQTKKTYFSAVALTKGITNKLRAGEEVNLKRTKKVLRVVVEKIIEDDSMLIGMTSLKDYDEYTHYHSVNVSILSIALGSKLGLNSNVLANLGMAALLHDIGKVEIPIEILNKPSSLTEKEWKIVKHHPEHGALAILKMKGVNSNSINYTIPAFEHHLNIDLSGYPKIRSRIIPNFFSMIISIADQYDALTSSRVYRRTANSPGKALSIITEGSGTRVDQHILKAFINMMGVYPIGSLVALNTNEMALVFENNNNPDFIARPTILLISDSSGVKVESKSVDLMEKDEAGNFKRSITNILNPSEYGINLAEYLL